MSITVAFQHAGRFALCMALFSSLGQVVYAKPTSITLLHTNDVHSHFRPDSGPAGLGGVARIKTAVDRIRNENRNTLLVDGGDWSEGTIYYTQGNGDEALKLMDQMGYDVAVVGNHDWLNGPDVLLDSIENAHTSTTLISSNLIPGTYSRAEEFKKFILPYAIRTVGGGNGDAPVKIAFIGLSTYELIYDTYIAPVKILSPASVVKQLSENLKKQADIVIVISHNSISANKAILAKAPAIDMIVGAHDHVQLNKPTVVNRKGANPGWIVETGFWGRFLGQVDMSFENHRLSLNGYKLIQMDATVPEDPAILKEIERVENTVRSKYGDTIFSDQVATAQFEVDQIGVENSMGNLTTDAFVQATGADLSMNTAAFIYTTLHKGPLRTVDIFNSIPAVYNPTTQKTWTIKMLPFSGRLLKWLFNILYSIKPLASYGPLALSGAHFVYDPLFLEVQSQSPYSLASELSLTQELQDEPGALSTLSIPIAQDITVQGKPIDSARIYQVALGQGMVDVIQFLDSYVPGLISLAQLKDTGIESWQAVLSYIRGHSITESMVHVGTGIQTQQGDLGIYDYDFDWIPGQTTSAGLSARITVRVKNYGATRSAGGTLHLYNQNCSNQAQDKTLTEFEGSWGIPALEPGSSAIFSWNVVLPTNAEPYKNDYPITAKIQDVPKAINKTHNEVTHWFHSP